MKLLLAQIPPGGLDIRYDAPQALFRDLEVGMEAAAPATVLARATHEPAGLHLTGEVAVPLRLSCSRCLATFDRPVDTRFDATFSAVVEEEDEVELDARELTVYHLEGDSVDMDELVREQVLLEVPFAPLCDPDCKGLCLHCGADLNQGPCGCNEPVDPRFAALKKLL